ncbi:hypothetical protein ACA910_021495 [Epithemia clementina (nom. ined.)]
MRRSHHPLDCICAAVLLFLHGTATTKLVQASCSVTDSSQKNLLSQEILPQGLVYESDSDIVHCMEQDSCKNFSFRGCYMVHCQGVHSCFGAHFEDNHLVSCRADHACAAAYVESINDVVCGDGHRHACADSRIRVFRLGLCNGPLACVAEDVEQDGITFVLPTVNAVLACANGRGKFSCRNLRVYIDDESRACFAFGTNIENIGPCAVMCETNQDCDYDSIDFVLSKKRREER